MGKKFSITFDIKTDNVAFIDKLRDIIEKNYEKFVTSIRPSEYLDIDLEETDY